MKTAKIVPLHKADPSHLIAPRFNLEEFLTFLPRKLRKTLNALIEWGKEAIQHLKMSNECLDRHKKQIAKAIIEYKAMLLTPQHC